tara:strand:- start:1919 stop:3193 length:1275 start_codon:yes stop_codon:yes gene_type:complete
MKKLEKKVDDKPKSLIEKIFDIQCEIRSVEKVDTGGGVPFKVITYNDVNKNVREMLEKHRVCAIPETSNHIRTGNFTEVVVGVRLYNLDNPEDTIKIDNFVGYGVDNQDKGIGKAYSYGYKYLFLKLFNMNIGKDEESEDKQVQRKDNPALKTISKAKKTDEAIDKAFENGNLEDGETDETEFGHTLQPEIGNEKFEFVENNLRASSFGKYAFGIFYNNSTKKYSMSPKTREEALASYLKQEVEDLSGIPAVQWGKDNERCGIAKWMLINKSSCLDYGDNQKNYVTKPIHEDVVLSATPDGLSKDKKTIIEVKCSGMGRQTYKEFPKQYLPQIMGQMLVLNMAGVPTERVHLVNWTAGETKVWEVMRNDDYINKYLLPYLVDFASAIKTGGFGMPKLLPYKTIAEAEKLSDVEINQIYGGGKDD